MSTRAYGKRKAPVTSGVIKEEMLVKVLKNPHNSIRSTVQQVGISQFSLVKTFEEELISPYHLLAASEIAQRQALVIKWYISSVCCVECRR
jgi:hypothetical protein